MKTRKYPMLVILLSAIVGAAIIAGISFILPDNMSHRSASAEWFVSFIRIIFGHLATNPAPFLIVCGTIIGAVAGVFLAGIVPNPKIWLGILFTFVIGIIVGGAILYFPGEKLLERNDAISECRISEERAQGFLDAWRAIHRGTTNSLDKVSGRWPLHPYQLHSRRRSF